jgi:RNA polymerase sigma-70 factor (ECF subfamily)
MLEEITVADLSAAPSTDLAALGIGLRALPPEQRAVVALHLYLGYSVQETAQIMDSPIGTTRSRLRLARERLRRALAENEA